MHSNKKLEIGDLLIYEGFKGLNLSRFAGQILPAEVGYPQKVSVLRRRYQGLSSLKVH